MPISKTALRNDKGERVCSCGCGTVLGSRHPYIKGHNTPEGNKKWLLSQLKNAPDNEAPKDRKADGRRDAACRVSLSKSADLPPVAIANNGNGHSAFNAGKIASDGAYLVPCQVSEWAMDRIWLRLTPEEKAELLFRPPEAPQKEQQEPSHA